MKDVDNIPEPRSISNKQPKAKQLLMKMAVDSLSPKQREIWFRWNNERLTQDEIAAIFNVNQKRVSQMIQAIEKKLTKFIQRNKGAYILLKLQQKIMSEGKDNE